MEKKIKKELAKISSPVKAKLLQGYFKTGKGQYGEGDVFIGITVPLMRKVAKEFEKAPLAELQKLMKSRIHEHRFTALEILAFQFEKGNKLARKKIVGFYLKNLSRIDNWDLVDTSAPYILGPYIYENKKEQKILRKLVRSKNIWEKRIAMLSSFYFIAKKDFAVPLELAETLIDDSHDLIQKAVGWMLREIGKRDLKTEQRFLDAHHKTMPRTALRYAIERFDKKKKAKYMGRKP